MDNAYLFAIVGSLFPTVLSLRLSNVPAQQRPDLRDGWYWSTPAVNAFLASFFIWAYTSTGVHGNAFLDIHIGASACWIAAAMATHLPGRSGSIDSRDT